MACQLLWSNFENYELYGGRGASNTPRRIASSRGRFEVKNLFDSTLGCHRQNIRKLLESFELVQSAVPIVEHFVEFDDLLGKIIY